MAIKIKEKINNNYKLISLCIILSILAHAYFLKNQFLNDQYMMGISDQFSQMIIFKDLLYYEFSHGNFFYSFLFNGGANIFTRLSYYYSTSLMFYITALFTFFLEQLNIISSTTMVYWANIAVFINIFRSVIILFVSTKYISLFVKNDKIALLGATFYAFSNIYFRHVTLWEFFGDAMIWLPIILLGVEYIIRKGDGKVFALGIALTLFNNGYFAFANLLFTLIYILIRLIIKLQHDEMSLFIQIKNYIIYGLIGIFISLPGFIPFVLGFMSTSRLSPEFTIPLFDNTNLQLSNLLLNDQVQVLPIAFILVATNIMNYKSKTFRVYSVLSFILIFLKFSPFVASVFNGLSYPQFRWHYITFLMIAVVIAVGAEITYNNIQIYRNKAIIYSATSLVLTIFIYFIADYQAESHYFNIKIVYLFIVLQFLIFTILSIKKLKFNNLFMFLLFISSLYTVFVTNKQLYYDYKLYTMNYDKIYNAFENPNDPYERALEIIEDDSDRFYRIDFSDMENLGSQKKFSSFNVYSSFQNHYQQYFYRYFQILNSKENNGVIYGLAGRQVLSSIFQSDYVIAPPHDQYIIPSSFEEIEKVDDLSVFKNQIPLAFIHPVKNLYSIEDVDPNAYKDDLLIDGAIVPKEYSNTPVVRDLLGERLNYIVKDIDTDRENNVLKKADTYFYINVELDSNEKSFDDLVIDYTIKPLDDGEKGRYTYSLNGYSIQLKSTGDPYSSQLYRHQTHIPFSNSVQFNLAPGTDYIFEIHSVYGISHDKLIERSKKDNYLEYNLEIKNEKIKIDYNNKDKYPFMVLPIFYEKGWEVEVNGEKAELLNVNNGMVGFNIPAGEVKIKLAFKQPLFKITMILSLSGILFLVFWKTQKDINHFLVTEKNKLENKDD